MDATHDYTAEDIGNIVLLEHVNVEIPDQAKATLFYVIGLGFTRDPYINVGLGNMWINVGEQQFHLPTRTQQQVIPGIIGLVVPDLDLLKSRLEAVEKSLEGTQFRWSAQRDSLTVTCPWGNHFRCYGANPRFGDMALGMPYVEFLTKPGSAKGIARFYQEAMQSPSVVHTENGMPVARVEIGRNQWLLFKETSGEIRPYDGHHIAIYVANFSGPYAFLKRHNGIMEDVENHQFRFKDIVDPETGQVLFQLEHEVRGLRHKMYRRPFVNRDPTQTQRDYHRGRDGLIPFGVEKGA
jgi:hypothetical protein